MLVLQEAAGLNNDFLAYVIRSLLSEGRIDYLYTDFEHRRAVQIQKEGPTGLITSSVTSLDPELATRVITPSVADDAQLTRAILLAAAADGGQPMPARSSRGGAGHGRAAFRRSSDAVTVPRGRTAAGREAGDTRTGHAYGEWRDRTRTGGPVPRRGTATSEGSRATGSETPRAPSGRGSR